VTSFWEKIFGKKKDFSEEDTVPLRHPTLMIDEEEITKPLAPLPTINPVLVETSDHKEMDTSQLMASCAQSVGKQRDHNEDALFCLTSVMASNEDITPFGLYIVADGMGGHQHGEVCSEIAIRTMADYVIRNLFTNLIRPDHQPPEEPLQEIMKQGIQVAHQNILEKVSGGGTTLSTVTIMGNQMTIAHVGDSRIYTINLNGRIKPITRDHSLVKRLEELGQLTPEEAAVDPRRNVLYHALGQGTPLDPEIISAPIPHSGYLLVCSDGLWGVISENKIGNIITSAKSLPEACQSLIKAANDAGGPDNISVILIRLPD